MDTSTGQLERPSWKERDDTELLLAWKAGRRAAGEVLFERHYGRVALFFHNKVTEPDELIQRTFLAAVESAERFRVESSFRAYLRGIALNVLRNHYRHLNGPRNHVALEHSGIDDGARTASEVIAVREAESILLEALRRLPTELQVLLELYYWERMKTSEIAAALQLSLGTVRDRLRRARRLLEDHIRALEQSQHDRWNPGAGIDDWAREMRRYIDTDRLEG